MQQHPLSAKYWSMPEEELQALAADIKANGLRQAIVMYEGMVLDGWQRVLACKIVGVKPRETEYRGEDPQSYVISLNHHRRHGNSGQRAAAVVGVSEWHPSGRTTGSQPSGPRGPLTNEKEQNPASKTNQEMAAQAGVGTTTIKDAKAVEVDGSKALKEAVKEGKISVRVAAGVAKKPKKEQARAVKEAKAPKERKPKKEKPAVECKSCAKLREQLDESDEKREILADELQTFEVLTGDAKKAQVAMEKLREEIRYLSRRNQELTASRNQCIKQCKWWETQARRLGYKRK